MRPAAGNKNLGCDRIKKPELIKPRIKYITQGWDILQFQACQNVKWQEYTLQAVVDLVVVLAIVSAVGAQYVEELNEDYIGGKWLDQCVQHVIWVE